MNNEIMMNIKKDRSANQKGTNQTRFQLKKKTIISNTFEAIARRYFARKAPDVRAQSLPLFLVRALRAASTATTTSSAVAAGISPVTAMLNLANKKINK